MPFTTLQERALVIPRQPVPGSQFQKVKFNLGEVHTILPPVGTEIINCQGIDVGPEGKKFQITKELVALIQAGFIRIANDIVNPDAHKHNDSSSPSSTSMEGDDAASHTDATGVSSLDLRGKITSSPVFSSVEEIQSCQDQEKLRLFVKSKTGYENEGVHIEALRNTAERLFST